MKLEDYLSNWVFKHSTELFRDGTTSEEVRKVLSGLDNELKGLGENEATKIFEDTTFLKSYVDKRTSDGIKKREENLKSEFNTNKSTLEKEIETLKSTNTSLQANTILSANPDELRKQALDEVDVSKRELLNMRADNIEIKNQLAERTLFEENQLKELTREKLVNVARTTIGDRKIPKSIAENLHMFVGPDEETTVGKINNFNSEWDDFTRDMLTAGLNPATPPGPGEPDRDPEEAMREKMSNMDF